MRIDCVKCGARIDLGVEACLLCGALQVTDIPSPEKDGGLKDARNQKYIIPGWAYFIGSAMLLMPCSVLGMMLYGMTLEPIVRVLDNTPRSCLVNPMFLGGSLGYFVWAFILGSKRKIIVQTILYISIAFGFLMAGGYTNCGEPGIRVFGSAASLAFAYLGFFCRRQGDAFFDAYGQEARPLSWKYWIREAAQYLRYTVSGLITFYLAFMLSYLVVVSFTFTQIRLDMSGSASNWALMTFAPLVGQFAWGVFYGFYTPFKYRLAVWIPLVLIYGYLAWEIRSISNMHQFLAPALCAPAGLFLGFQWQKNLSEEAAIPKPSMANVLQRYLPKIPVIAGISSLLVLSLVFNSIWGAYAQEQRNKDLISAARSGDVQKVKLLVEQGADINYKGYGHSFYISPSELTPLAAAVESGSGETAMYLIKRGAKHDPNKLLPAAAATGEIEVVNYLLQEGVSSDTKGRALASASHGHPFAYAGVREPNRMQTGTISVIKRLLKEGLSKETIDQAMLSASSPETVKVLLQAGGNINSQGKNGKTLLMQAVEFGKPD